MAKKHSPAFLRICDEARANVEEVTVDAAWAELRRPDTTAVLIDVREESEWNNGHAAGAIHLGKGVIERDIENRVPDQDTRLLLYCGGGFRSALAAENLGRMGYSNAASIAGGWSAWVESGKPTSTLPEVCPRSPHQQLGGICHLPRLIDKARLYPAGKLPGYLYMTAAPFDKMLLDLLCLEPQAFERVVREQESDGNILGALRMQLGASWPSDHAVKDFNQRLTTMKPGTPEKREEFDRRVASFPATRRRAQTWADLIDLEEGWLDRLNSGD